MQAVVLLYVVCVDRHVNDSCVRNVTLCSGMC